MATKKKKAAPRRAAKRPARRKAAPVSGVLTQAEPSSNKLFFVLLFLGLAVLGWLTLRSCGPKPPVPSVAAVPAALAAPSAPAQAAAAAPAATAAPARSVAAPSASSGQAVKPASAANPKQAAKPAAHRESAGAQARSEASAPALSFERGKEPSFSVRCWRSVSSPAQVDIFGRRNRRVRSLKSESGAAGWVQLEWDGKDEAGKKVPEGAYFLRSTQESEWSILELRVKD